MWLTPLIHIQPVLQYPMTSTPVALDVCHGRKPRRLQDAKRVIPIPLVHQPPIVAWLPADPLPEPWVSCESNATGFPTHFVAPSRLLLPLLHILGSSIDDEGNPLAVVDPRL